MARKTARAEDLVDINDMAARAGIKPNTIRKWRMRHQDFPLPFVALSIGPVWIWADVRSWIEKRIFAA